MNEITKMIPGKILTVMKHLDDAGFSPYLVGGCVRDCVMGKAPHDYDITVCANPKEVQALFEGLGYKTYDVGIKFGTVSVLADDTVVEITPYRTESGYSDSRHPDSIEFVTDIKEDLSRRDFTVNALALDKNGQMLDVFGGIRDIENKIIRCVGNPNDRFSEDALRILRAIRFASRLGFEIEENTLSAMHSCKDGLSNISGERIHSELYETLLCKNSLPVLEKCMDILRFIIPDFTPSKKLPDEYGDFPFRLFACLCTKDSEKIKEYCRLLKLSNAQAKKLLTLSQLYPLFEKGIHGFGKEVKHLLCSYPEEIISDLFVLFDLDTTPLLDFIKNGTYKMNEIAVKGTDIIETGLFKKEETATVLRGILEKVSDGSLENNKEKIIEFLKENNTATLE